MILSVVTFTSLSITLLSVTVVNGVVDYNINGLDCSDLCFVDSFSAAGDNGEKVRLQNFLNLINRVKRLRIKHNINSTIFTVDSSVTPKHGTEYDHAGIFTFQQNLAALIAFSMPAWSGNPAFANQFDGEQAWYCDSWSCNSRCAAVEAIFYDFENVLESSAPGLVEDGCHLGKKALRFDTCFNDLWKNPLLVAIINSKVNDHNLKRHKRSSHESSCRHYRHRLVVGTHATPWNQIKEIASTARNAFYIEDSAENKKTLAGLIDCMQLECCLNYQAPTGVNPTCMRTLPGYSADAYKIY